MTRCGLRSLSWNWFLAAYVALIAVLLFAVPAHAATRCRGTNGRFIKCPPPPAPTPTPAPVPAPTPSFAADVLSEGDSISQFWGGNHTGIYASTHPALIFVGHAIGGSGLGDPTEAAAGGGIWSRQATDLAVHAKVFTVLIGANNLYQVGSNWYEYTTPQAYADALFAYLAPFRVAGTKVAVGTVLPQCTTGDPHGGIDAITNSNRAVLNPIIRAAVGSKIDAVIDFAADPVMGPDAAACDTTLYQPGGLHPTDGGGPGIGGQGRLEAVYAPVVDRLLALAPAPAPAAWILAPLKNGGYARCTTVGGCHSFGTGYAPIIAAQGDVLMYAWNGITASNAAEPSRIIAALWPIGQYKSPIPGVGAEGYGDEWEGVAPAP